MADLSIALSDPQDVSRFSALAEQTLTASGQMTDEALAQLLSRSAEWEVHLLDAERALREVAQLPAVRAAFAEAERRRPQEKWFRFEVPTQSSVVIVLDASGSASQAWRRISRFAEDLAARLSSSARVAVMFLGGAQHYPGAQLARQAERWRDQNALRASLIGPVFEQLEKGGAAAVILGAGPIFDLEDWMGTPVMRRTCFVRFGAAMTGGLATESDPDLQVLAAEVEALANPVTAVQLGGPGVMPVFWDNAAYGWTGRALEVPTRSQRGAAAIALRGAWLCAAGCVPRAQVTRREGPPETVQMEPCPPLEDEAVEQWRPLTAQQATVLRARNGSAERQSNGADPPTCADPGITLLRQCAASAQWCCRPALRLDEGSVAIRRGGGSVEVYRLRAGEWRCDGEAFAQPHQVDEHTVALAL